MWLCGRYAEILCQGKPCHEIGETQDAHFVSTKPAGVSQGAAWVDVQMLVASRLLSTGDAKLMTMKESVYGGEVSRRI